MGISIWQLVIVLAIVVLLFGTKKLRNMGGDIGGALKSFRKAVKDSDEKKPEDQDTDKLTEQNEERVIEGEVTDKEKEKEKDKV